MALLVDRQHDRMGGRVDVKADDVLQLHGEVRISEVSGGLSPQAVAGLSYLNSLRRGAERVSVCASELACIAS